MAKIPQGCCPRYHRAVEIVGARWNGAILQMQLQGVTRFSELQAAIPGLTGRMLSQRLKQLESEGLIERRVIPDKPVRIEYRLTPKGRALSPVIRGLSAWAERWIEPPTRR